MTPSAWDRLFTRFVKTTSALVFLALGGLPILMVSVAVPLIASPTLTQTSANSVPLASDQASTARWVPQRYPNAVWLDRYDTTVWAALDEQGALVGELTDKLTGNRYTIDAMSNLPPLTDIFVTPNIFWLVARAHDGHIWLIEPRQKRLVPTAFAPVNALFQLPDKASFVALSAHQIDWMALSITNSSATLLATHTSYWPTAMLHAALSPALANLAVIDDDQRLVIWRLFDDAPMASSSLLTSNKPNVGRNAVTHNSTKTELAVDFEKNTPPITWLDMQTLRINGAANQASHWQLKQGDKAIGLKRLLANNTAEIGHDPRWLPGSQASAVGAGYSLIPLLVGSLKVALVAIFIGGPIAVAAAVYVGHFSGERARRRYKPTVELIAAFPNVAIGAIAALWLAPQFYQALPEIIGALLLPSLSAVVIGVLWRRGSGRNALSNQKYISALPILMVPAVLLLGAVGAATAHWVESSFFDGSVVRYLQLEHGFSFSQRSSLLVSCVLGFAVMPIVFTLAEDVVHSVPRDAAAGSLALGASHWRSFRDIVLPMALPGVISALMLGFSRAMGETMIVLLVSGNSPELGWDISAGARALSATLAIELPTATEGSLHYRVLFAAALLLFSVTLAFNTVAQLLRQRLYVTGVAL